MLDIFYEEEFKRLSIHERKISLEFENTIVTGPPRSGKSFLLFHLLSTLPKESYLYLDCEDFRLSSSSINKELQGFIEENSISLVVFDNYDPHILLPTVTTIITTKTPLILEGFKNIVLHPLDFEEYIAFQNKKPIERKSQTLSQIFGQYLKDGTLPESALLPDAVRNDRHKTLLHTLLPTTIGKELLFFILSHQGFKLSFHHIYKSLKEQHKISKDTLYRLMDELFEKGIILGVEKFGQPNAPKKLFPYDFSLVNMVRSSKDLLRTFEAMIFLELHKKSHHPCYTNGIDFFVEHKNEAILALPFATEEMVRGKLSKLLVELRYHGVQSVTIITMGLETTITFDTYTCQVVPFWTWAVSL